VLTSPESVVSSILYSTVTLTFDLLMPNCEAFICVPQCIVASKFGENESNALQDIMLTMFWDTCMAHERTHGQTRQTQYPSGHTTLGGGITNSDDKYYSED